MRPANPIMGDVYLLHPERDAGKPWDKVTDFEMWDGTKWISSKDMDGPIWVEIPD